MKVTNPVKLHETYQKRHNIAAMLHRAQSLSFNSSRSSALDNFSMSDCYKKLVEIVPTIPRDRKVSRVEILQHVIDYIQDLQTALDNQAMKRLQQHHHESTVSSPNRTPFSTLQTTTPGPSKAPLPSSVTSEEIHHRSFGKQISCTSLGQKLHPYETPESSPESQTCSS